MLKRPGYLALETRSDKPDLVRLIKSIENPLDKPSEAPAKLRFVMHFDDIETAYMNAQSNMSHHLIDLNNKLFKRHLGLAMGDIETIELEHELVWKDPDISEADLEEMNEEIKHNKHMLVIRDRFITVVKWSAILYLAFNMLSPLIAQIWYKFFAG